MDPDPFASGGYGDVYEGTLDGSRVCIKRVRVYARDGPKKATKARYRHRRSPCPPSLTKPIDLLPRGCYVETFDAPKHCAPAGCYHHSLPADFELDVGWGPARLY